MSVARAAAVAALLLVAVRVLLVDVYRIPTSSMEGTLLVGDYLVVNKAVFGVRIPGTSLRTSAVRAPRRGEVIVFRPPHDPERTYVKRVVGVPGDLVKMAGLSVWVNDIALDEPYARYGGFHDPDYTGARVRGRFVEDLEAAPVDPLPPNAWGPVIVPDGKYFVLGDNRDNSEDSRFWGFVDRRAIRGAPLFVYYSAVPSDRASGGSAPWWTRIRWERLGAPIW